MDAATTEHDPYVMSHTQESPRQQAGSVNSTASMHNFMGRASPTQMPMPMSSPETQPPLHPIPQSPPRGGSPAHSVHNLDALLRNIPANPMYSAGAHANASMTFPMHSNTPPRSNSEIGLGTPATSQTLPPMSPGGNSRQNALLSLLLPQEGGDQSSPGGYSSQVTPQAPRPGDAQGKALLEQIMANPRQQTFPFSPPQGHGDSGPPPPQHTLAQNHESPVPMRKSMFEFVSPFDSLNGAQPPEQQQQQQQQAQPQPQQHDPPRQDVPFEHQQQMQHSYTGYPSPPAKPRTPDVYQQPLRHKQPSPIPSHVHPLPAGSGSEGGKQSSPVSVGRRDMSPARGGTGRTKRGDRNRKTGLGNGNSPTEVIEFDVSVSLDPIKAGADGISIMPIALLKLDSIYLPGTTIAASYFIAYAMTKGRVRLISRSNGARALLKLPPTFSQTTSVVDMVAAGNCLACITSDGGAVVWEVPNTFDDERNFAPVLLLQILPSSLRTVKWHINGDLALASDREVYLLDAREASDAFHGTPVPLNNLGQVAKVFVIPSSLISFTFDYSNNAIATISTDSVLRLWSIKEQYPIWQGIISGQGEPSSVDVFDVGVIVGRKQGTILQLLAPLSTTVLSTLRFISSMDPAVEDDGRMFGHLSYDSRLRTLWVANSARASLIAVRVLVESDDPALGPGAGVRGAFEQIMEFPTPAPTINITLLAPDDAEEPQLAVAAFAVHVAGVDQINVDREAFEHALATLPAKLPPQPQPQQQQAQQILQQHPHRAESPMPLPIVPGLGDIGTGTLPPGGLQQAQIQPTKTGRPPRGVTPPPPNSDDPEPIPRPPPADLSASTNTKVGSSGASVKSVKAKDKEREKGKNVSGGENDGTVLKEIRKVEENLHTKIGRLITRELDKQHQRLDELRVADQAADFTRQETILKLISNELTKNTTRVVEVAIRSEVQNSVLPALEQITKVEIKNALSGQIARGVAESMKQTLPNELERLLLRPDVSNHVARTFSQAVTPLIERHVKEAINTTLIPAYQQSTVAMHQELSHEIHSEILSLKKEIITWQSEALKGSEATIRDMEISIRNLSDQVKALSMAVHSQTSRISPGPNMQSQHIRNASVPSPLSNIGPGPSYGSQQQQQPSYQPQPQPQQQSYNQWMQPQQQPQQQQPQPQPQPQSQQQPQQQRSEDWDDTFLGVLSTQDHGKLRELLARCNPEVIMPSSGNGQSPLSQAVVLTLIHRLSSTLSELSPLTKGSNLGDAIGAANSGNNCEQAEPSPWRSITRRNQLDDCSNSTNPLEQDDYLVKSAHGPQEATKPLQVQVDL
ncbi:inactive protein kinase [Rhizoctonia solani]|uniref:Inactive protein kinase n=1 Tax=Rhizoctonia solani TaxID=456999 RepID=A0A8H8NS02_9AGAM|nr:inactive protein kinase [Rhizoctonia solani]QRW17722.1 inactive protein kinase [Rhizoctonia solani]